MEKTNIKNLIDQMELSKLHRENLILTFASDEEKLEYEQICHEENLLLDKWKEYLNK
jgi:hypothetical protein